MNDEPGPHDTHNEFGGVVDNIVQAREITGDVHFHRSSRPLPVPRQLPPDIDSFTGRVADLAALDALLPGARATRSTAVVVSAIAGTPGVGKTALAVHWAHLARGRFPDGQLHVSLHGYDPVYPPVPPEEALRQILLSLNVSAEHIPVDLDARTGLYRSLVAGKRILVLLDDAKSSDQVRPLLPGSPSCTVVVTSRSRLSGLLVRDGAHSLRLDLLPFDDAVALLRAVLGTVRCNADPAAVARLAQMCECLPLALRIAAEQAAAHPRRALADLVGELEDEQRRLDVLTADEHSTALRAVFSWSYEALSAEAARMFRLMSLHTGPDLCSAAAAALAGTDLPGARRALDQLAAAHLVEESGPDRYRFHDLLRLYATERRTAENSDADNENAVRRCLVWYLHTADTADATLIPQRLRLSLLPAEQVSPPPRFSDYDHALHWLEVERANLVAAVFQAAACGEGDIAWKLPLALWAFFYLRKHWDDHIATHRVGIDIAERTGNRQGRAWLLGSVSLAYSDRHQFDLAVEHATHALDLCVELGDRWGEGTANNILGDIAFLIGDYIASLGHCERALPIFREIGDLWGEATALTGLGNANGALRRYDTAIENLDESLSTRRRIGDRWGQGHALHARGDVLRAMNRPTDAIVYYGEGLAVRREIGDRHGQAVTLFGLGWALADSGSHNEARECRIEAEAIFRDLGDPQADEVAALLGALPATPQGS